MTFRTSLLVALLVVSAIGAPQEAEKGFLRSEATGADDHYGNSFLNSDIWVAFANGFPGEQLLNNFSLFGNSLVGANPGGKNQSNPPVGSVFAGITNGEFYAYDISITSVSRVPGGGSDADSLYWMAVYGTVPGEDPSVRKTAMVLVDYKLRVKKAFSYLPPPFYDEAWTVVAKSESSLLAYSPTTLLILDEENRVPTNGHPGFQAYQLAGSNPLAPIGAVTLNGNEYGILLKNASNQGFYIQTDSFANNFQVHQLPDGIQPAGLASINGLPYVYGFNFSLYVARIDVVEGPLSLNAITFDTNARADSLDNIQMIACDGFILSAGNSYYKLNDSFEVVWAKAVDPNTLGFKTPLCVQDNKDVLVPLNYENKLAFAMLPAVGDGQFTVNGSPIQIRNLPIPTITTTTLEKTDSPAGSLNTYTSVITQSRELIFDQIAFTHSHAGYFTYAPDSAEKTDDLAEDLKELMD